VTFRRLNSVIAAATTYKQRLAAVCGPGRWGVPSRPARRCRFRDPRSVRSSWRNQRGTGCRCSGHPGHWLCRADSVHALRRLRVPVQPGSSYPARTQRATISCASCWVSFDRPSCFVASVAGEQFRSGMLGAGLEPERKQIGDSHADIAARCGHDNADLRVVVGEHLPVPTARGLDPSAVTAHSNDVGDFSGAAGAGGAQRDKFSTRPAGEVVKVHSNEHSAVRSSNSSAHGVNPIFTGSGVGVRVDCPASLVHQLHVLSAERTGRRRHHVHVQTLTCGRSSIRSLDRLIEPNAPIGGLATLPPHTRPLRPPHGHIHGLRRDGGLSRRTR